MANLPCPAPTPQGRDKASWAAYLESDHGAAAHPPALSGGGDGRAVGDRAAPVGACGRDARGRVECGG